MSAPALRLCSEQTSLISSQIGTYRISLERKVRMERRWQVQEAKARFSELLRKGEAEGPQIVTHRGVDTAVVVPIEHWRRIERLAQRNIKEWLLAPEARAEIPVPGRERVDRRPPPTFE